MALPATPWKIKDNGSCYRIVDAHGRNIAFFYYRENESLRDSYLNKAEAEELAKAVAQLSKREP